VDVTVGQVAQAVIDVDFYYEEGKGGPFQPVVKNILVSNVACQKSRYGIYLRGYATDPISGVTLSHCTFNHAAEGNFIKNAQGVKLAEVTVNGKPVRSVR
jgi:hypothetical protein